MRVGVGVCVCGGGEGVDEGGAQYVKLPLGLWDSVLCFRYVISEPADKLWGERLPNGTWAGMTGMLHRKVGGNCIKVIFCVRIAEIDWLRVHVYAGTDETATCGHASATADSTVKPELSITRIPLVSRN